MIVSFATAELRDCCCKADVADKKLGTIRAAYLGSVISDAEAAETAADFIELYQPEEVDRGDSLLVMIGADYAARFVAVGESFDRGGGGAADWSTVRRVKLVTLEQTE